MTSKIEDVQSFARNFVEAWAQATLREWGQVDHDLYKRLVAALAALRAPEGGTLERKHAIPEDVIVLARAGRLIDAIKLLRHDYGIPLKDAKEAVENALRIEKLRDDARALATPPTPAGLVALVQEIQHVVATEGMEGLHWSWRQQELFDKLIAWTPAAPVPAQVGERCPYCSFNPTGLNDYCDKHRPALAVPPVAQENIGYCEPVAQEPKCRSCGDDMPCAHAPQEMPTIEVGDIIDDGRGGYGYMRVTAHDGLGSVIATPSAGDDDEDRLVPIEAVAAIYRTPLWRRPAPGAQP